MTDEDLIEECILNAVCCVEQKPVSHRYVCSHTSLFEEQTSSMKKLIVVYKGFLVASITKRSDSEEFHSPFYPLDTTRPAQIAGVE